MALIYPFAALRPVPQAAARVAAVPYDVVNTDEARALAQANPLSFLHVSRAEIDLPAGTDPYSEVIYARAMENFNTLRERAPLVVEETPSLYVYQLHMGPHVQTGIAGAFSIDEYDRDIIKKHEKTRPDKEDDRTRHMIAIGAQTGPVFLTYKASPAVDQAVSAIVSSAPPLFDLTAPDHVRHMIWRVPESDVEAIVDGFAAIPYLYIADGHHRAASAARTRRALAERGPGEHDRVLAVAFPDNQMQVLPYNRTVADLHGLSVEAFLTAVRERFSVTDGGPTTPRAKGQVAMYVGGKWYTIDLGPATGDPSEGLDVSRLQTGLLTPVLGIGDPRTDKRIDFIGGIRGTDELVRLVDNDRAAVAFSLYPVSVDDLMHIADAGGIMPPKSTWFEPKLRDGLLSHII